MLLKEDRKIVEVARVRLQKIGIRQAVRETGIPHPSLYRIKEIPGVHPHKETMKKLSLWICRKVVNGK